MADAIAHAVANAPFRGMSHLFPPAPFTPAPQAHPPSYSCIHVTWGGGGGAV